MSGGGKDFQVPSLGAYTYIHGESERREAFKGEMTSFKSLLGFSVELLAVNGIQANCFEWLHAHGFQLSCGYHDQSPTPRSPFSYHA